MTDAQGLMNDFFNVPSTGPRTAGRVSGREDEMTQPDEETTALTNLREQYDAFSAMRNDLNEILGDMISQEATLKDGPEMAAECAAVVDAVARFKTRQAERIAELERALAEETEACAKVAECHFDDRGNGRSGHHSEMDWTDGYRDATRGAAAAIRARAALASAQSSTTGASDE